jgi:hypothetical protein
MSLKQITPDSNQDPILSLQHMTHQLSALSNDGQQAPAPPGLSFRPTPSDRDIRVASEFSLCLVLTITGTLSTSTLHFSVLQYQQDTLPQPRLELRQRARMLEYHYQRVKNFGFSRVVMANGVFLRLICFMFLCCLVDRLFSMKHPSRYVILGLMCIFVVFYVYTFLVFLHSCRGPKTAAQNATSSPSSGS